MAESASSPEQSSPATNALAAPAAQPPPMDFANFQAFIPDGSPNSYQNMMPFDPRNMAPWPMQTGAASPAPVAGQGSSPAPPVFMPFPPPDGPRNAYSHEFRLLPTTGTAGPNFPPQPWLSSPLTFIPATQWAPPMEFHNVTESDMRERGKAAAAAGKNLESPFVINQGLPLEYRSFPFPPLGLSGQPQVLPSNGGAGPDPASSASSSAAPSFFVGVQSPFIPTASSPFASQHLTPYPPTPVINTPKPLADADRPGSAVQNGAQHKTSELGSSTTPHPLSRASTQILTPIPSTDPSTASIVLAEAANRARRLNLFQETSEESFEESLMNGGYGMYRTSTHVPNRDPLPPANPLPLSLSHAMSPAPPLSAKEARKRKRLAAFLRPINREDDRRISEESKLKIYQVEGMGRILSPASPRSLHKLPNVPQLPLFQQAEDVQPKKRGGYRKRRPKDVTTLEKPDWPDADFYWRLRADERQKDLRFEQDEKMKMINGYLDTSSDDEDRDLQDSARPLWRFLPLQEGGEPFPSPLLSTDPSDAQAVLMSKRRSRAFAHRRKRRRADDSEDTDDDESFISCLGENCRRPRSSRGEVQCDHCKKWFHLTCIGVGSVQDLGPEDSNWYCDRCEDDLSETPKGLEHLYHPQPRQLLQQQQTHPILVPSPPDTRPETPLARDYAYHDPSTPMSTAHPSPMYPVTPLAEHRSNTPVFDPTSTPSRGMKIHPSTGSVGALWAAAGNSFKSDTWTPKNIARAIEVQESPSVGRA